MSFTRLAYHIAFATKDRLPLLKDELLPRVCAYVGGILRTKGAALLAANGAPDHLHILATAPASLAPADLVRLVKTNSSRWIHETFPRRRAFAWQEGYAAFSVSASVIPKVTAYIDSQHEHHASHDFKEELTALLRRHGIDYDEAHLWG